MSKKKGSRKTSFGAVSVAERGSWVRIRWRENGKTVERSKSTWEEACTFARQVETRLASGGLGSPEGTFGGVADAAMRRENLPNYSDKAYDTLRSILRIHIMPSLGAKKARLVSTADCAAVLRTIFDAGYSKHTVAKARKILSKVGAHGVKYGVWTAGQEPTLDVPVPKSRTTDMNVQLAPVPLKSIPVESQVESLLAAAKAREQFDGGRAWFVIEMAQLCALRWSEIRALRKPNFDWEQRTVSVWTSRDSDEEKMTKTGAGVRRVVRVSAVNTGNNGREIYEKCGRIGEQVVKIWFKYADGYIRDERWIVNGKQVNVFRTDQYGNPAWRPVYMEASGLDPYGDVWTEENGFEPTEWIWCANRAPITP